MKAGITDITGGKPDLQFVVNAPAGQQWIYQCGFPFQLSATEAAITAWTIHQIHRKRRESLQNLALNPTTSATMRATLDHHRTFRTADQQTRIHPLTFIVE